MLLHNIQEHSSLGGVGYRASFIPVVRQASVCWGRGGGGEDTMLPVFRSGKVPGLGDRPIAS